MKFLNLLFVLAFVFSLASCGGAEKAPEAEAKADSTKTEAAPAEAAPADSTKTEEKAETKKEEKK